MEGKFIHTTTITFQTYIIVSMTVSNQTMEGFIANVMYVKIWIWILTHTSQIRTNVWIEHSEVCFLFSIFWMHKDKQQKTIWTAINLWYLNYVMPNVKHILGSSLWLNCGALLKQHTRPSAPSVQPKAVIKHLMLNDCMCLSAYSMNGKQPFCWQCGSLRWVGI